MNTSLNTYRLLVVAAVTCLALSACKSTPPTTAGDSEIDYFPVQQGNMWVYGDNGDSSTDTVIAGGLSARGNQLYHEFITHHSVDSTLTAPPPYDTTYYRKDYNGNLYQWISDSSESLIARFQGKVGSTWAILDTTGLGTFVSLKDSVTTAAGNFLYCSLVTLAPITTGTPYTFHYAPSVGLVRSENTSGMVDLISAKVNGRSYP